MVEPNVMIAASLTLQRFYNEALLLKLVEKGVLTNAEARKIALETATFGHELSEDPHRMEAAIAIAQGFEQMAESFSE